jgi:hypothetical protein
MQGMLARNDFSFKTGERRLVRPRLTQKISAPLDTQTP